jgi:predicted metal-dependent peptidase
LKNQKYKGQILDGLDKKISQAKAKLLVDYPYFGTLASKLELVLNDNIEAFRGDGKKLEYSHEFLQNASISELEFVLANGAMHVSLAHESRKNGRSGWLWQMATDMAINDMLVENGLDMPYGAQYRKRFAGMYAEEIYAELKSDMLREEDNLEYEADDAEDVQNKEKNKENNQNAENQTQLSQQEQQTQFQEELLQEQLMAEEAISLLTRESKKGEAPLQIERFFTIENMGKIDWRDELKSAIDRYFKDDYTLLPPSKKLISQGIYLPSNVSQTFRIVVAIDSSGSIDDTLLSEFLSEVNFLMSMVARYQIELLVCDEKIQEHKTFTSGEALECSVKGASGTDFRPVFAFVEREFDDVKLLLYFTDLEGIFPHKPPNYEVKWVSPKQEEVPFGTVIVL